MNEKQEWLPGECARHLPTGKTGLVEAVLVGEWVSFCPFGRALGHGLTVKVGELRPLGYKPDALEMLEVEVGLL